MKSVGKEPSQEDIALAFERLADWIDIELELSTDHVGIPELAVLTDLCGYGSILFSDINPMRPQGGWAPVLGMLVLAFPEIHWVFTTGTKIQPGKALNINTEILNKAHHSPASKKLIEVLNIVSRNRLTPLFDGTGLRDAVRAEIALEKIANNLPRRISTAISVDEERSYTWLHAYTTYRFGFRAQAVTTYGALKWVLRPPAPQPELAFEDYYLQFGDGNPVGLSHLEKRDTTEGLEPLSKVRYRIFVTSGHHRGQATEARTSNPTYLKRLRGSGKWNCELNKPLGGIFNLWKDSGLERKLRAGGRIGLAAGYNWPSQPEAVEGGHSAPGRLLIIADRLIVRSERLLSNVRSVPQAVRGALLATDALELLGGKTPTTSLEALALKHQFEVLTECQFVGTQQHMDVKTRVKDIQREVRALSGWFGARNRQRSAAAWNAELSILNKLIEVFRSYNQFDEEMVLQARVRKLHRKLLFVKYPPLLKPLEVFPWYVEKLVASFPLFVAAISLWIVALGMLYSIAGEMSLGQGVADAYNTFLGIGPPDDKTLWEASHGWTGAYYLVALTIALGFVHLGIFISHLYSIISRK